MGVRPLRSQPRRVRNVGFEILVGGVYIGVDFGDYLWEVIGGSIQGDITLFVKYGVGSGSQEEEVAYELYPKEVIENGADVVSVEEAGSTPD